MGGATAKEFDIDIGRTDLLTILKKYGISNKNTLKSNKEKFKEYSPLFSEKVTRVDDGIEFTDSFGVKHRLDDGLVIGFGAGDISLQLRGEK